MVSRVLPVYPDLPLGVSSYDSVPQPQEWSVPSGEIVARGVAVDEYMERYAQNFCEYIEGYVINVSPQHIVHFQLEHYLLNLLSAYLALKPIGTVITQPFVMRVPLETQRRREPDLFVVLNTNPAELTPTYMDGAADVVIEIVSQESAARDYGDKLIEYEAGGVGEYWIIDPIREQALFHRRTDQGVYALQTLEQDGGYLSPALPGLKLHVPTLWSRPLPNVIAIVDAVRAMLGRS